MALTAGEYRSGGKLVDSFGRRVVHKDVGGTALAAGSYRSGGRVFDSDGREVIVGTDATATYRSGGVLFDGVGRRVVNGVASNQVLAADERQSSGRIVNGAGLDVDSLVAGVAGQYLSAGLFYDGTNHEIVFQE
jgi:hypothetical protein